jgi:hypothetical protein
VGGDFPVDESADVGAEVFDIVGRLQGFIIKLILEPYWPPQLPG